jgi:hypothetical protein
MTAEQKAKRLKVKEAIAALDGRFCEWILAIPDMDDADANDTLPVAVYCDKPAWYRRKVPGVAGRHGYIILLCPYHAQFQTVKAFSAERERDSKRFAGDKTRAEIIAIRDGVAA